MRAYFVCRIRILRERAAWRRFVDQFQILPMNVDLMVARITYERAIKGMEAGITDPKERREANVRLTAYYNDLCRHIRAASAMGYA